jgi:predicted nucleic acid-binding protein
MSYLLDTSILARLANKADVQHHVAVQAVVKLHNRGEVLHTTPQVLIEFRNVATRPKANNGLELPPSVAESISSVFESVFSLVTECADVFPAWKSLVQAHTVIGKQVHDARLIAICQVHDISHLLTFNASHFNRFSSSTPQVIVATPASI